jgi:co-chaperonin GroES (HSP10)
VNKGKTMIKATGKRYIIKAQEQKKESAGGIILQSSNETQFAVIISVGGEVEQPLEVGTVVVIDWNHTVPLKYEDVQYYVIDSRAIAAVVEDL